MHLPPDGLDRRTALATGPPRQLSLQLTLLYKPSLPLGTGIYPLTLALLRPPDWARELMFPNPAG